MTSARQAVEAPPPVRVQIVAPLDPEAMPIGGIAAFVRGFVKFAPPAFEIELVGTGTSGRLGAWREATLEGRRIRHLPVARTATGRGVPRTISFTLGLLRRRSRVLPGAVRQFHRPATALPLLRGRDPRVEVVHLRARDLAEGGTESRWRHVPLVLRVVEWLTLRQMDIAYVVNEEAAAEYRRAYPTIADRIAFIPNWVDDETFGAPTAAERAAIRTRLRHDAGLADDARVLLLAARLERQKDPLLALRAAARVMAQESRVALVVAGDGRLRSDLAAEAQRLAIADRVRLLGPIERTALAAWMQASDVLVISSVAETGPTVGLEALATGLPVATTAVGRIAAIVAGHACGALATGHEPDALAEAIGSVLAGDSQRLRDAALEAVAPYRARTVLPRLYDDARRLATAAGARRASGESR